MKLTDLPDELIGHIASFLDQPKDFRAFSLVSRDCRRNAKESHPDFPLQLVELDGSYARKSNPLERVRKVRIDSFNIEYKINSPGLDPWHRGAFMLRNYGHHRSFNGYILYRGKVIRHYIKIDHHRNVPVPQQVYCRTRCKMIQFGGRVHQRFAQLGLMSPVPKGSHCDMMEAYFCFSKAPPDFIDCVREKLPLIKEYEYFNNSCGEGWTRSKGPIDPRMAEATFDLLYELNPEFRCHQWWEGILPQLTLHEVDRV